MNETKEPLQVSDWSQPYKLTVYVISIFGLAAFIYFGVIPYAREVLSLLNQLVENTSR